MASFTCVPAQIGFVRIKDLPVRSVLTQSITVTGSEVPGGAITVTKVGGASWLSVPANVTDDTAFDMTIVPANLPMHDVYRPVKRSETVRFSYAAFDDLDVVVTVIVKPGGPPP